MQALEFRLQACELANVHLQKQLSRQRALWLITMLFLTVICLIAGWMLKYAAFDSIKAREVVVVGATGTVRARLGGNLPDAVMANGHVSKRGSIAAGLIIYDEQGIERGGYVTQDEGSNAMLTLDSKFRQSALFVAGPTEDQTSALKLWSQGSSIELRSDGNGARLSVADKMGVHHQQPKVTLSPEACKKYRTLENQYPKERICQSRFTEDACKVCLGQL